MIKILDYVNSDNYKRAYGHYYWHWISPCNCYLYNGIQHNDGGYYHTVLKFYKFNIGNKEIYILIKTDTREFFGERKYLVYEDYENYILLELFDWEELLFFEIVEI